MIVRNRIPSTLIIEAKRLKGSYGKRSPVAAALYITEKQNSSLRMFNCGKGTEGHKQPQVRTLPGLCISGSQLRIEEGHSVNVPHSRG